MNLDLLNKDNKPENSEPFMYTEDQLMARLRFFIGICLALTLTGIVFVVLYSIIFVTQPLNAISPIDQKFFEMLVPISTFLTGILSGIMLADKGDKEAKMKAIEAATRPAPTSPTTPGIMQPRPFTSSPFTPSTPSVNIVSPASQPVASPPPPNNMPPPPPPLSGMPPPPRGIVPPPPIN